MDDIIDNVIKGPWKTPIKVPEITETNKLRYNLMLAEDLTEAIIIQAIRVLEENDVANRDKPDFIKDFGLVNESLKACIFRHFGFFHPIHLVSDAAMVAQLDPETKKVFSQFDLNQLNNKEFNINIDGNKE
jgi:hypothetical protein|tara:strand:+ start:1350 stop:1742 length:393 start_codon:yes stop_codon:yes gene_type:complete